jgi:MOSC domain-containing protein YiiM
MRTIRDLAVPPQTGRIEQIVVRGRPRQPARSVRRTQALANIGLEDDRLGQRGQAGLSMRQVTLIQHEHLAVIAQLAGVPLVDAINLRRNLVVSGINLLALRNQHLRVGGALLQVLGPCTPCSRMEDEVGPGAYAAMRGHGGMTARVLESGWIEVGSTVGVEPIVSAQLELLPTSP